MRIIVRLFVVGSLLILSMLSSPGDFPSYFPHAGAGAPTLAFQSVSQQYVKLLPGLPSTNPSPWLVYPTSSTIWVAGVSYPPRSQISEFFLNGPPTPLISLVNVTVMSILADPANPSTKVWFTDNSTLAYYDTNLGKKMSVITFPMQSLQYLANDTLGRIWVSMISLSGDSSIAMYNPQDNSNRTYSIPITGAFIQGIAPTLRGSTIWFADAGTRKIGRLVPGSPPVEFSPPSSANLYYPIQIAIDSLGKIWFTDHGSNLFGVFDPLTTTWHVFPIGYCLHQCLYGLPNAIFVDAKNTVWFSEHVAGRVGHYNPSTTILTEYGVPGNSYPQIWWAMPGPNNLVWFVAWGSGQIGYVNASLPIPVSVSGPSTDIVVQRGFSSSVLVSVLSQGQSTISFGISPATQDQIPPAQIYGSAPSNITLDNNSQTVSFSVSAAWNALLGSRYVTLTASVGQVSVSVPVVVTVVESSVPLVGLGFASVIALAGVTIALRRPKRPKADVAKKARR